jgi:hypothetical protein
MARLGTRASRNKSNDPKKWTADAAAPINTHLSWRSRPLAHNRGNGRPFAPQHLVVGESSYARRWAAIREAGRVRSLPRELGGSMDESTAAVVDNRSIVVSNAVLSVTRSRHRMTVNKRTSEYITIHQHESITLKLGRITPLHDRYILWTISQSTTIYMASNPHPSRSTEARSQ